MPAKTLKNNHREEPRYYYSDVHLTWRKNLGDHWRKGILHNLSQTGFAMALPATTPIRAGQQIELMRKGSDKRLNCQIIRTELWRNDKILIAGRLPHHNNSFAFLKRSSKSGQAKRWLARKRKDTNTMRRTPFLSYTT